MTWVNIDIGDVEVDIDVRELADDVAEHLDIRDEVMSVLGGRDIDLNDYIDSSEMRESIREELYESFDDALEDNDEFTELRRTVQRLVEHLALPVERTGEEQIQDLVESGQITLANLETIVANQCGEWRSNMKKMNKTDLLVTAQRMGYHLNSDMTIAQIHEVVGL